MAAVNIRSPDQAMDGSGRIPDEKARQGSRRVQSDRPGLQHAACLPISASTTLSAKVQSLFNPGGTAILMYNGTKPEEMDFYRNLGAKMHGSGGAPVSDEFWIVQEDDPDWFTVVGSRPHKVRVASASRTAES